MNEAAAPWLAENLEEGLGRLSEHGFCIIPGALDVEMLRELHDAVYRTARNERKYGWSQPYQYGQDDHINQRIWNLPSRDPVFCALAEHPLAIEIVRRTIGWPASLTSMSANITNSGGGSMMLHTDQGYVPEPWGQAWVVNLGWCIDDFTVENGATLIAPGSHLLNRGHRADEPVPALVPAVAPAGSAIVVDGRTWHTNGPNRGGTSRAGIFAPYALPILLPQENWSLSLDPAIRQFGSETLQTLFGFRPQVLGRVNGMERI